MKWKMVGKGQEKVKPINRRREEPRAEERCDQPIDKDKNETGMMYRNVTQNLDVDKSRIEHTRILRGDKTRYTNADIHRELSLCSITSGFIRETEIRTEDK